MSKRMIGAAETNVGLKRSNNEDSFFLDEEVGLFLVADGMGGAASGEVASQMVAETIGSYVKQFADASMEIPERYDYYDPVISDRANTLLQAVHLANMLVHDESTRNEDYKGMGSTLACVLLDGDDILAVNVGDSPVFRMKPHGEMEKLTIAHRLAEDPRYAGQIDPDSTMMSQMGNTLTRAMGVKDHVHPDLHAYPFEEGDIYLMCSDGLTDMVQDDMIAKVLGMDRSLEQKAKDLVDLALAGGGRDNVTVVIAEAKPKSVVKGLLHRIAGNN